MAFQESLPKPRPRLKSRAFPTAAFGKLFLKRFGRIILRFAVFWPTLSWRFRKVCQSLGRVSKAAHSLPLHSKAFRRLSFPCFGQHFRGVSGKFAIKRPYHCIRKIVFKAFRTHQIAFPTPAFGKFFKAFRTHHSSFCRVLANTFVAFQESLPKPRPRLKSRAFPTTAFGKLLLKRFGRIILRFAVFWPTLLRRFKKVCQSLGRVSKAAHSLPLHSENCC